MTLTLEEVRNTKFHMARRSGYEVSEVDVFVDKVEAAFAQITEENQMMRSQLEALQDSAPAETGQQAAVSANGEPTNEQLEQIEQARHEGRKAAETEYEQKVSSYEQKVAAYEKQINELKTAHANELKQAKEQAATAQSSSAAAAPAQTPAASAQAPAAATTGNQPVLDSQGRFVVTTAADAGLWVQRAVEQANQIAADADSEAKQSIEGAKREAQQLTDEAKGRASRVEQEARANAERIQAQAQAKATDLDRELGTKRTEMLSKLESERDQLNSAVTRLRSFEGRYRQNLTKHLQDQIKSLESGHLEPSESESAGGATSTNTPRLDALAGDQDA